MYHCPLKVPDQKEVYIRVVDSAFSKGIYPPFLIYVHYSELSLKASAPPAFLFPRFSFKRYLLLLLIHFCFSEDIYCFCISVSMFLQRHLLLLFLLYFCFWKGICSSSSCISVCVSFLRFAIWMPLWGSGTSGGVMDEIIDRSARNKAVTFIALSDLLRHLAEQTEGEINCSGSHRSCHAETPDPTSTQRTLLSLAPSLSRTLIAHNKTKTNRTRLISKYGRHQICGMPNQVISHWGIRPGVQRSGRLMKPTWRAINFETLPKLTNKVWWWQFWTKYNGDNFEQSIMVTILNKV